MFFFGSRRGIIFSGQPDVRTGSFPRLPERWLMAELILPGDVIRSRKPHPCGGDEWTVLRTGADIRIRCNTCGRLVMMDRESFLKRRKALVSRSADASDKAPSL